MTNDSRINRFFDDAICGVAPLIGLVTSLQQDIEYWVRLASLIIGLLIGMVHLYRLLKK